MVSILAGGIGATLTVLVLGIIISIQPFLQPPKPTPTLLAISIVSDENMPTWCQDLAGLLNERDIPAAVFFSGKVAEQNPDCVSAFGSHIDIGSSTYSYTKLTEEPDYSMQLNEVSSGKKAVDNAGNLYSRSFRAPYGETDENIYSLLSRSNVLADFSYKDRYHKYHENQFIWFKIQVIDLASSGGKISDIPLSDGEAIQINIDNTVPLENVKALLNDLGDKRVDFVNASDLTGLQLTVRGGS